MIQHDDGTLAEYSHLKHQGVLVQEGSKVIAGQTLALSGNTGFTTEPHLHVMVFIPEPDFPFLPMHSIPIVFDTASEPALSLVEGGEYQATEIGNDSRLFLRDFKAQ